MRLRRISEGFDHQADVSERIHLIDAMRGFSLAGIAMAHFGEQYLGSIPPPAQLYNLHGTADAVLEGLSWIFIRGKGFGIFSFLFGLSFSLQMQRAEQRGPRTDFRLRFAWRLFILFGIGWLHCLAYRGDILTVYAVLGVPLMFFYRVPDRWLLILAFVLLVGLPRVTDRLIQGPATPQQRQALQGRMNVQAEQHWRALSTGDVATMVRLNATTGFRAKWDLQFGVVGRGYQTFGLFLLGLWAGRRRLFQDVHLHRLLFVRLWRWTGALTLLLPVIGVVLFVLARATGGGQTQQPDATLPDFSSWQVVGALGLFDAWNNAMTLFYVASFALLSLRPRWQARLVRFGPAGRMALSVYVSQTLLGALIFFGFGLGLLGRVGNSIAIPMGLAVFVLQVWASRAWLTRFRFGPLEYLWRSLTWFRLEPFRARDDRLRV
jgi:uncharacterized protein